MGYSPGESTEKQVTGADVTFTRNFQVKHRLMAAERTAVPGQHTQQMQGESQKEMKASPASVHERMRGDRAVPAWSRVRLWEW